MKHSILVKRFTLLAMLAFLASSLTACLDSDSGGNGKTAKFVDSAVVGISYKTSSGKTGVTGANGQFKYKKGDTVTFYIGAIELPAVVPDGEFVTPAHIAGVVNWQNDTTTLNIARFLQSIDDDGDLSNGIQVSEAAAAQATAAVDFKVDTSAFESAVADYMAALNKALVTEAAAQAHLSATINELGIVITIAGVDLGAGASTCTAGTWGLTVETVGIPIEIQGLCYTEVPDISDVTTHDATLTNVVLSEDTPSRKVFTAQAQGGVQVKYIFTLQ